MKRFLTMSLVMASMVVLFSCSDSKIYVPTNADLPTTVSDYETADVEDFVIEVNASETLALIASKEHFVLYIGNSSCSACLAFKPSLIEYIDKSSATIYHFDNLEHSQEYIQLPTAYPDYFTADYAVTPSLYFFKEGLMTARRNGSTRMMEYSTFRPIMDGYMRVSNIKISRNIDALTTAKNNNGIIFFYDRSKVLENEAFVNVIYPKTVQNDTILWVADISMMYLSEEEVVTFTSTFEIEDSSGWLVKYTDASPDDTYQIITSDDPALESWLSVFF